MKYSHCRGCGRPVDGLYAERDGLCDEELSLVLSEKNCSTRFERYAVKTYPNENLPVGFSSPLWSARIDLWLEKGMP